MGPSPDPGLKPTSSSMLSLIWMPERCLSQGQGNPRGLESGSELKRAAAPCAEAGRPELGVVASLAWSCNVCAAQSTGRLCFLGNILLCYHTLISSVPRGTRVILGPMSEGLQGVMIQVKLQRDILHADHIPCRSGMRGKTPEEMKVVVGASWKKETAWPQAASISPGCWEWPDCRHIVCRSLSLTRK